MSTETTHRILKYELPIGRPRFTLTMPRGAKILSVGLQDTLAYLWASGDEGPGAEYVERIFRTVTDGEFFNEDRLKFVGHILSSDEGDSWFIWEVNMGLEQLVPDTIPFLSAYEATFDEPKDDIASEPLERKRELVAA